MTTTTTDYDDDEHKKYAKVFYADWARCGRCIGEECVTIYM